MCARHWHNTALPSRELISCDMAEVLISRRIDGEIAAGDEPVLDAHLKICAYCRANLETWAEHSRQLDTSLGHSLPPARRRRGLRQLFKPYALLPLGMMAAPALALAGLALYFSLFGSPVSAPRDEAAIPLSQPFSHSRMTYQIHSANAENGYESGYVILLGDVFNGRGLVRICGARGGCTDVAQPDINASIQPPLRQMIHSFIAECTRADVRARLVEAQHK